jgi:hypothetical protein
MEKLPTFNSAKHEFTYFAIVTMKNAMAIQAIENRLNVVAEKINELIDKDPGIDLEAFKAILLSELATLLNQKTEFEFSNSLFDLLGTERTALKDKCSSLELRLQSLTARILKLESALGHEKVEGSEKSNTCPSMLEAETPYPRIVLIDVLNRESVADVLVADNVHPSFGTLIVELLNNEELSDESCFVLKPSDYKLSRGVEDSIW